MPPVYKARNSKKRDDPLSRPGQQLGTGESVGPARKPIASRKNKDDGNEEYTPDMEERSPSPEGPEAEEVAEELAALAEEYVEVTDDKGNSLGMFRVGGKENSEEVVESADEALIERVKQDEGFQENSTRRAMRMHLIWARGLSDAAVDDDSYIDAGELANDKVPAKFRKLVTCSNGSYIKRGDKYSQLNDEELRQLGRSNPCDCNTCTKQRDFAGYIETPKRRSERPKGKNSNSVGYVLGSG